LVGSAERDGQRRIVVLNGTESKTARRNTAISLMNAAFTQFKVYEVYAPDQTIGSIDVYMGKSKTVDISVSESLKVGLARMNRKNLRTELHSKTAIAPISKGDVLGEIIVFDGDRELKRINALAAEET